MKVFFMSMMFLGLICLAGCGHVEANYPQTKVKAPKSLPESYQYKGEGKPLIWQEDGAVRGFLSRWEKSSEMVERMRHYASMGNSRAAADARLFESPAAKGYNYAIVKLFVARDVERIIRKGDFRLHFLDGTTAEDQGAYLYQVPGKSPRPDSSFSGTIELAGKQDKEMKGRTLYIFSPRETQEKTLTKIEWIEGSGK